MIENIILIVAWTCAAVSFAWTIVDFIIKRHRRNDAKEQVRSGLYDYACHDPFYPRSEQIADLQAWMKFYLQGCYTSDCVHPPKVVQKQVIVDGQAKVQRRVMSGGKICRQVNDRTWKNRFDHLSPWLADVENLLKAGEDLIAQERIYERADQSSSAH